MSRETAGVLCDDGVSAEAVATVLAITRSKALVLLLTELAAAVVPQVLPIGVAVSRSPSRWRNGPATGGPPECR
ncbi:hypothetical protein ACH4XT_02165 [Streptomyces avidinii]|uniref:hypothetical protein n=1 Tax=Streptomyces avidinii TaxID=1895 RepID=UPI0037958189